MSTPVGLRDRALIGTMLYSFARVSARRHQHIHIQPQAAGGSESVRENKGSTAERGCGKQDLSHP